MEGDNQDGEKPNIPAGYTAGEGIRLGTSSLLTGAHLHLAEERSMQGITLCDSGG